MDKEWEKGWEENGLRGMEPENKQVKERKVTK